MTSPTTLFARSSPSARVTFFNSLGAHSTGPTQSSSECDADENSPHSRSPMLTAVFLHGLLDPPEFYAIRGTRAACRFSGECASS